MIPNKFRYRLRPLNDEKAIPIVEFLDLTELEDYASSTDALSELIHKRWGDDINTFEIVSRDIHIGIDNLYTGDIVEANLVKFDGKEWVVTKKLRGDIMFRLGSFGVIHKIPKQHFPPFCDSVFYDFTNIDLTSIKVIGNKYDNPELLKRNATSTADGAK